MLITLEISLTNAWFSCSIFSMEFWTFINIESHREMKKINPSITVTSHCHCTNKCPKLISVSVNNLSVWNSFYSSSSVIIEFCYSHLKSAVASSSLVPPKPPLSSSSAAAAAATCLLWSQLITSTYCSLHLKSVEHAWKKRIDHVVPYLINQEVFSVFKYTCICCIADNKGSLASVETVVFWM